MVKRLRDSTGHSGRASRNRCSPRTSLKGKNDMFRRIDVCLALLAGLGLGLSVFAKAQDACTASGIAGTYVVTCNGYISAAANAPLLPATLLASANAAKNGQWSGTGTLSLGGSIVTQDVKSVGPAQVNPDCTGSITYSQTIDGQPAPDIHFNFIVGRESQKLNGISTDPGTVFSCTLTRVGKSPS